MTEPKKLDDLDRPIWGAAAIAAVIERDARATYYLLENGYISAAKKGGQWVSTKRRLRRDIDPEAV